MIKFQNCNKVTETGVVASSETITDFALRKIVKLAYFWLKGDSFNRASCTKIWASGTITSQSIQAPLTSHTTSFPVPSARIGTRLAVMRVTTLLGPTMLGVVGTCWRLLRGACKRTQHLPTLLA